jgi:hypothetical protein
MTNAEQASRPWLDQALLDPGSVFASSEAVVDHPAEIAVAEEEEGMQGPDRDLLQRIIVALARPPGGGERVSARRRALPASVSLPDRHCRVWHRRTVRPEWLRENCLHGRKLAEESRSRTYQGPHGGPSRF